jgi:hypothetical protein
MPLNFARIARVLTIFGVMGLLPGFSLAQTTDPLLSYYGLEVEILTPSR